MKRIILSALLCLSTCLSYAQADSAAYAVARLKMVTGNRYATLFVGHNWIDALTAVDKFNDQRLRLTAKDNVLTENPITSVHPYSERIAHGRAAKKIFVKYNLVKEGDNYIIKGCEITGNPDLLVLFFVQFWNTKINFDTAKQNEIANYTFMSDKVSLIYGPTAKPLKILITKGL